ncbi:RecQ family ATP-dependent DNA helicase [Rhodococcus sp. YH1]|uniref:RecQ family ATP-dependent DNA helicase n=1 Tax=Rhodococcus sp. YH1 TaxID=89066 RepID=UPI001386F60D|nr:ATP-dependent RNA helicase DeaD [Rhodococcus sp. YH1]
MTATVQDAADTTGPRDIRAELRAAARRVFGWEELRPGQLDAMEPLVRGRDVLAVMATGSGKSAIYQVPALLIEGTTLVISPLIALQNDQIAGLDATSAPDAVAINSRQRASETAAAWETIRERTVEYVFLAPEQLANDEVVARLADAHVSLVVVDEAHCVSAWGHDFRPDYLRLADALDRLARPPVVALTATASPPVRQEIVEELRLRDPVVIASGFDRPNIDLAVERYTTDAEKRRAVIETVAGLETPGLLYTATRKDAEFYAAELAERGRRAAAYHAGLPSATRERVHHGFLDGEYEVVVATSAFGMGIDKPDVRFVAHASAPDSVDSYYQQIGRAGRDGLEAKALLFYRPEDLSLAKFFTTHRPDEELLGRAFTALRRAKAPTRLKDLRAELDTRGRTLTNAVNLLERAGVVSSGRKGFTARTVEVEIAVRRAAEVAAVGERMDRSRVEMMRGYAETRGCRRQFLLGYFGESLPEPCGHCDCCREGIPESRPEPANHVRHESIPLHTRVVHAQWGAGEVMSAETDRITVLFDGYGYRTLSLEAVEEHDLLRPENSEPEPEPDIA